MASKELSIIIKARDLASAAIKGVRGQVKGLGDDAKRAVSNASRNLTRIGVAAAGALAFAIGEGIRSITAIQKAQAESQQLIKSTGAAAGQTMDMLIARSQKWEAATGKNEEDIQHLQNVLLTFTKIGPTVFDKATEAALNMSQVLGQDLQSSAIQLGKALNDPVKGMTALRRVGVSFTEEQIAQVKKLVASGHTLAAQELILAELNTEFGGQAAKYGQTLQGQWDRFKQTVQEAERALATAFLPVLTKVGAKLNEFLGRKDVQAGIANLGAALARNLDKIIGFVEKLPWQSIGNAFKLMGQGAQAALDLFLKAPPWLQTAVLTGWGLNKLTGGALGDIVGKLGAGLIKGVLGMTAGVVNARAAVVNVAGGIPGGGGGGVPGGGALPFGSAVAGLFAAALADLAVGVVGNQIYKALAPVAERFNEIAGAQSGMAQPQLLALINDLAKQNHTDADTIKRDIVNAVDTQGLTFRQAVARLQQSNQQAQGPRPINPATVSDYALRHRAQVEKPVVKLDAAAFMAQLSKTAFIGPAAYKSIWERIGGKGRDPFGEQFVSLLKNLKPSFLKTPSVLTELKGKQGELINLEKFYLSRGQTANAQAVDRQLAQLRTIAGLQQQQTPYQREAARQAGITASHTQGVNPELAAIRASSAITAAKKTLITNNVSVGFTADVRFSTADWIRSQVSYIRAHSNSGGFQ